MELAFATRSLRIICESPVEKSQVLPTRVGHSLMRRLADLRAATSIRDVIAGQPTEMAGSQPQVTIDLGDGHWMVLIPNHVNNPRTHKGDVDWARVSRVQVVEIAEHHD